MGPRAGDESQGNGTGSVSRRSKRPSHVIYDRAVTVTSLRRWLGEGEIKEVIISYFDYFGALDFPLSSNNVKRPYSFAAWK